MARSKRWNLLTPRWVLTLLAVIAADVAMIKLGQWQWHAGRRTGNITNYSYAFQWWAFTVFAVWMYLRVARDFLSSADPDGTERAPAEAVKHVPEQAHYVAYVAPSSVPDYEGDPERARFNQYLDSLYSGDGLGPPTSQPDSASPHSASPAPTSPDSARTVTSEETKA